MGTIWVREFTGGLDTRRLPETSSGAVLVKATDGHVSRGGEFEKRAAFVPTYGLPSGTTVGMAYDKSGVYVFSHLHPDFVGSLPKGVSLQRLQHPTSSSIALARILSFDNYAGKIYAVAEFADGGRYHFYDGTLVEDFRDGRARATFTVTAGGVIPASVATGSFTITGGSSGVGNQITSVQINGVSLTAGPVSFGPSVDATAQAVASAINAFVSAPDYTAQASGAVVTIASAAKDGSANGRPIVVLTGGNVTVGSFVDMAGGAPETASSLSSLTVDGVDVLGAEVKWRTSHAATASAIADQINLFGSNPNYSAVSNGASVSILADIPGAAANGRSFAFGLSNGLNVFFSGAPPLQTAGGADTTTGYTPGTFVKTIGSRMHTVAGPNEHGSGLSAPTSWQTSATGAYFIDMSTQAGGAETLTAIAKYQRWVAVFSERVIQVWNFDSDPNNNSQVQVMNNTGTASPKSVTPFSDNDLFYCAESGVRSLRARDASNAAATTDIGVPVDTLVSAKLRSLTSEWRARVTGLIEPRDGRFWLIMKDVAFVFSYFPGAKISAWSQYNFGFDVQDAFVYGRRVYLRSGDTIYVYGGLGDEPVYDATPAEAWLPYLDAERPSRVKHFTGMDAALEGKWQVSLSMRPDLYSAYDDGPIITATTYGLERVPIAGAATHLSVRMRSVGTGPAKLGSVLLHYTADADED